MPILRIKMLIAAKLSFFERKIALKLRFGLSGSRRWVVLTREWPEGLIFIAKRFGASVLLLNIIR